MADRLTSRNESVDFRSSKLSAPVTVKVPRTAGARCPATTLADESSVTLAWRAKAANAAPSG
jgi:hypothetical protein